MALVLPVPPAPGLAFPEAAPPGFAVTTMLSPGKLVADPGAQVTVYPLPGVTLTVLEANSPPPPPAPL
jgi:hypothetical protein